VDLRAFQTSFVFHLDGEPGRLGDGFTFAVAGATPPVPGTAGGGLGYQGITDSVAIKFDLVENAGEGTESVGVFTGGAEPTTPADRPPDRLSLHLNSGRVFEVEMRYSGGTLFVDLADAGGGVHFTRTYAVDIPAALGGPTALVGFTAGTGELFAPIDVLSWTYTPTTDAAGNAAPAIVDRPRADTWYVAGTSTQLRVEAFDDGPAGDLRYTWEVLSVPQGAGPVGFSANGDNAARTTTATFTRTGRYRFRVAVTDAQGNWTRSDPFWVEVDPVPGSYVISPSAPEVLNGTALDVQVQTLDQFGDAWVGRGRGYGFEVVGPGYYEGLSGDYYAPVTGTGPVTFRHIDGTATGSATVTVVDLPPTTVAGFSAGFDQKSRSTIAGSAIRTYPWVWLTQGTPNQAGASFHATRLDVTAFETKFRVRLGWPSTAGAGTGMAFVVQGVSPTAVGAAGAGLGYQGIDRSVAVTLDAAANAIGLGVNGAAPTGLVSLAGTGVDLRSGDYLEGDVVYDGTSLRVNLTDVDTGATATATWAVDIPAAVGGGTAFVGFTGATGDTVDRYAVQYLEAWCFRTVPVGVPDQPPAFLRPPRLVPGAWYSTSAAYRQARAADDGGPFNLRTRWELVSAPPGAKPYFYPAEDDPVRFDKVGDYLFRVTATDVAGQSAVAYVPYTVESVS
jgi:Bacterial lectin/Legume lectin domain